MSHQHDPEQTISTDVPPRWLHKHFTLAPDGDLRCQTCERWFHLDPDAHGWTGRHDRHPPPVATDTAT